MCERPCVDLAQLFSMRSCVAAGRGVVCVTRAVHAGVHIATQYPGKHPLRDPSHHIRCSVGVAAHCVCKKQLSSSSPGHGLEHGIHTISVVSPVEIARHPFKNAGELATPVPTRVRHHSTQRLPRCPGSRGPCSRSSIIVMTEFSFLTHGVLATAGPRRATHGWMPPVGSGPWPRHPHFDGLRYFLFQSEIYGITLLYFDGYRVVFLQGHVVGGGGGRTSRKSCCVSGRAVGCVGGGAWKRV